MPQSLHQVYGHIVFSTKNRDPLITADLEPNLHAYLGGIVNNLGGVAVSINGMPDHVHVLLRCTKSVKDTDFLRQLKGSSSKWMNEQGAAKFQWQAGYGWFSVSANDLDAARQYVEGQKEHHRVLSFQEEYRAFLKQYHVDYDERYVWA